MNCPKCGWHNFTYDQKRVKGTKLHKWKRTNFNAHCPKCGHKEKDYR